MTNAQPASGAERLLGAIDSFIADNTNFEEGETKPSQEALSAIKSLLRETEKIRGYSVPVGEVSAWYGSIEVMWRANGRTLILATSSADNWPTLYFQIDSAHPRSRGQSIRPATSEDLVQKLDWLFLN